MRARRWPGRAVGAAVALLGAATLLGFLDGLAWPLELATVFRLQYAAALLLLVPPALLLRARRAAAAAALLALLNVLAVAPSPEEPAVAAGATSQLRLLLANVEVGNDRYDDLVRLVRQTRPDVLGVTELDAAWARELVRRLPGYRARLLVPQDDAYGIGLLSRVPAAARVERIPASDGPPTIVARLRPGASEPVTVVVTHVHTPFAGSIHERHLRALADARPRLGRRLAVCGDFNTVPWASSFRELAATGLSDLYDGSWPGYSWPTWNPLLRLPIDNCLVGGLTVLGHRHGPDIGSDHYPLVVDLGTPRAA